MGFTDRNGEVNPRTWADLIMFGLGLSGAAWEIFVDRSENFYVYGLIIILLRLGREATELIRAVRGNGK